MFRDGTDTQTHTQTDMATLLPTRASGAELVKISNTELSPVELKLVLNAELVLMHSHMDGMGAKKQPDMQQFLQSL